MKANFAACVKIIPVEDRMEKVRVNISERINEIKETQQERAVEVRESKGEKVTVSFMSWSNR